MARHQSQLLPDLVQTEREEPKSWCSHRHSEVSLRSHVFIMHLELRDAAMCVADEFVLTPPHTKAQLQNDAREPMLGLLPPGLAGRGGRIIIRQQLLDPHQSLQSEPTFNVHPPLSGHPSAFSSFQPSTAHQPHQLFWSIVHWLPVTLILNT